MTGAELYQKRIDMLSDAIALKEPSDLPVIPLVGTLPYFLSDNGATFKDARYNFPKAIDAFLKFYADFQPDATFGPMISGKANELAGSTMIDWPGRPGTKVPDFSTHQVIEQEYMTREEYPELINDFTGFMARKYIPRAFPNLSGLSNFKIIPSSVLNTTPLMHMYSPAALEAYSILAQIAVEDGKAAAANLDLGKRAAELGIPPYITAGGQAPFDIIGDYFRGTVGMLEDQLECPDLIAEACEMFAQMQIQNFQSLKTAPLPVKRVFFPMHKGMDGFMSDKQYRELYWKPFKKVIDALVEIDVTPVIYTEGKYSTRVQVLKEAPKGKCIIHFEEGDFEMFKRELGDVACISGGLHLSTIEWGKPQQIADRVKWLIDTCAPGGGYIMMSGGTIENAPRINIETMMETAREYGKK